MLATMLSDIFPNYDPCVLLQVWAVLFNTKDLNLKKQFNNNNTQPN